MMRQDVRTHAHDLNGALGVILASADLHVHRNGESEDNRAAFSLIMEAARKASGLVEKLAGAATADEAGMDSAYERDLDYLDRIAGSPDPVLADLERSGRLEEIPIVDRETGRLLEVLVAAKSAQRVLELGTAYGYSTVWMAKALAPGARIVTSTRTASARRSPTVFSNARAWRTASRSATLLRSTCSRSFLKKVSTSSASTRCKKSIR